jgi:hypothetical protein
MEQWNELIKPHYPYSESGRPAIALEQRLRIHFLQNWFGLYDPTAEENREFAKNTQWRWISCALVNLYVKRRALAAA